MSTVSSFAQETPTPENNSTASTSTYEPLKKNYYWFTPHASVAIPNPMNNTAFKKNFVGVYEINAGLDINVFKGIFVGGAYKNATLKITGLIGSQNFHYTPLMKINNAGLRVGAKTFIGAKNRIIYSASIMMGQTWTQYTDLYCADSTKTPVSKYNASYIEPEMSIYFLVESNFAIGATLSYSIYRKNFDPYEICLNDIKSPIGPVGGGSTQIFSFGFCFSYSFLKKKE
jgi:hypothetical protein